MSFSSQHPNVIFRSKQRTKFPALADDSLANDFNKLFPNQVQFGSDIYNKFLNRSTHTILAVALTQSGKTGSLLAVIHKMMSSYDIPIPLQNIFIITGHSSVDWLSQTKERFPKKLRRNIFHRNNLSTFSERVRNLTNVLIFIDETQIASYHNQSIMKSLLAAGINENSLFFRDIKFVLVSATPNSCVKRFIPKREGYDLVYMLPAPGYRSIFSYYDSGHLRQSKDLCGFDVASNSVLPHVYDNIREIPLSLAPKYHIIRTHHSFKHDITIENFRDVFQSKAHYLSMPDLAILEKPPLRHTFIFIKETLRCANTICKDHIGVMYERYARKVSDSAIIQGLAGRATGYHSANILIFSHIPSVERYRILWDNHFDGEWTRGKPAWEI
jgi:hypothetical protein